MAAASDKKRVSALLRVEPPSLYFPPPHFGRCVRNTLLVSNSSAQPCVFKMKSREPQRYVVRPSVGIVPAGSAIRLLVTLRPMSDNLSVASKDKFRIVAKIITAADELLAATRANDENVDALSPSAMWDLCSGELELEQDLPCTFEALPAPPPGTQLSFPPKEEVEHVGGGAAVALPAETGTAERPHSALRSGRNLKSMRSVGSLSGAGSGNEADSAGGRQPRGVRFSTDATPTNRGVADDDAGIVQESQSGLIVPTAMIPSNDVAVTNGQRLVKSLQGQVGVLRGDVATMRGELQQTEARKEQLLTLGKLAEAETEASLRRKQQVGGGSLSGRRGQVNFSTVLLCMIVAYALGLCYRMYFNEGKNYDISAYLPSYVRAAM